MPSYSAGSAYLQVLPSLAGFGETLRAELAKENGEVVVPVKPEVVGVAKTKADIAAALGDETVEVKLDVDSGAFAARVHAAIDAALTDLPKARLDADASPAEQKIQELRTRLETLGDKRIGIDISAADAMAEIQQIKAELVSIANDKTVSIDLRTDAADALAKLQAVKLEADRLDAKRVTVDVNVDDKGSAARSTGSIGALMTAGIALGPAIIPVAAAVAAAVAAIGTGAVAGIAGLSVLKLAFHGVGTAVTALGTAQQSQGQTAAQQAAQQISSANSVASAQDGVAAAATATADATRAAGTANVNSAQATATAERSLTDTYIAAGIAGTAAAQAVANAQQAVVDATRSAAAAVQNAVDSERMAEQQLANAQQQEQIAQENLTAARQSAERQLRSLALSVADGALAERQAQLNIQTSKTALDAVLANPTAPQLQREQAQLTYDQAVQQLADVKDRNANLAQDKAAADAKGVEGSTQVVAATRGVASATQAVQNAQDSLGKAQAAVSEAQRAGAESVAKAEQSLSNARAAQAETARSSAEKIATAQQAVASAQAAQVETARAGAESIAKAQQGQVAAARSLQNALAQQAAQAAATAGAVSALQKAMDALSPAGQQFARFIHDELQPKLKEFQAVAQQGLLPGVETGIRALFPLFPQLKTIVADVSSTMGEMAAKAGAALNSPFWHQFFDFVKAEAGPSLRGLGVVLGNIATGAAAMMMAFKPVWDQMGAGVTGLSAKFAAFWKNLAAGNSKPFNDFLAYVKTEGPRVMSLIGSLVAMFVHLGEAFAPLGSLILLVVAALAKFISVIPTPVLGPLVDVLWAGFVLWKAWLIIEKVAEMIKLFRESTIAATAAQWLLNLAMDANPIGMLILALAALAAIVYLVWTNFDFFKGIVLACWDGIKIATEAVWNAVLKPFFDGAMAAVRDLGNLFTWLWHNAVEPAWNGIKSLIAQDWAEIQAIWAALNAALQTVGGWFTWLWHNAVEPAWNGLGSLISAGWFEVKVVFDAMNTAVGAVGNAFSAAVGFIENAWNRLIDITKIPVNFVINTVYNGGIVPLWNGLASLFGLGTLAPAKALATGGVLPGYAPGVDTVPAILSPGEGVLVPEAVRGLGANFVYAANAHFSGGRAQPSAGNRFASGGIVGAIASMVTDPVGSITNLFSGVTNDANRTPGTGLFRDSLVAIPGKIISGVIAKAKEYAARMLAAAAAAAASVAGAVGSFFTGSGTLTGWLTEALNLMGMPLSFIPGITNLIMHESGGNPNAINLTDSNAAAGHPSQGLMQTIPSTFHAYVLPSLATRPITDPVANITAGVRYARANYGDAMLMAGGRHDAAGNYLGYDTGGWLPPGLTLARNDTGQPERVLTGAQWGAVSKAAASGGGQPINVHVYPRAEHNEADVADMVSRRLAFAMRTGA